MNLRICACCLPIVLLIGIVSCRSKPRPPAAFSHYREPVAEVPAVRRVVLHVPENTTNYPQAGHDFGAALAAELRAAGLFEVVTAPIDDAPAALATGHFQDAFLAESFRQYGADAVVFCGVRDYQPYWPPRVGATVHLVSTHEAVTLASVDGLWDASDKSIACQAYDFATTQVPQNELPHAEIVVRSPQYFNRFVARQIVAALASSAASVIVTEPVGLPD
ncbi:MAG: hypothetical protein WBF93_12075 [Pirellulales bacterium]